ncbi:MAG: hybrid sensor histidine kinase/response regulator [Pelodictyon luteolum]|uniref:histidine kinase n=1 Tax=Pelodictyon luteolum TaxID=1100 RepID=A0A165M397_PELLU|nr:ATP-binding protein [Pelodictyon luteolum]KZK74760.1 MAG: hybrid sensor histidine kinase/response regulator [Pelodictyon luteolum]
MRKNARLKDATVGGEELPRRFVHNAGGHVRCQSGPQYEDPLRGVSGMLKGAKEGFPLIDTVGGESFFRFLTENSGDVIWLYDFRRNRYVYASPSVFSLRGFTPEEICRQSLFDALTPASALVAAEEIQSRLTALQQGDITARSAVCEFDQLCKDGSVVPTEVMTTFLQDADGNLSGIIGVARDIRERRRIEAEKERMHSLLVKAGKMESVSRIAGGIAHYFNNSLQSILGHADLMLSRLGPASEHDGSLEEIRQAVMHCAELTTSLLSFARKRVVVPKVIACNDAIAGVLQSVRPLYASGIEISFTSCSELWPVNMDPSQFEEIIANLLDNAVLALEGGGRIDIVTRNVPMEGHTPDSIGEISLDDMVLVEVSDTGHGMAPEVLEHVFEPFFSTRSGASGLGLSTVYGIVEQSGGFVSVESTPGNGTIMKLFLPRSFEITDGPAGATSDASTGSVSAEDLTILLVDDEDAVRHITRRFLESIGFRVLDAENADEALARAEQHHGEIAMLLTDMVMPGMNGRELAEKLSRARAGLKTLFMSGYAADAFADAEAGAELHFLGKPFSRDALTSKIREVLEA